MPFPYRILLVDDEPAIRSISESVLTSKGYEVRTASDGFEALVELRRSLPDVLISDLSMPKMNGFELLSVVRRRFPQIVVVAMSGEYSGATPPGLITDAFLSKGDYSPEQLTAAIAELLVRAPLRPSTTKPDRAPVWIPRSSQGYFVITCTECLRSFPVEDQPGTPALREIECIFCDSKLQFLAGTVAGVKLKGKIA